MFQSTRPCGARRITEQTVSELVPVVQTVLFQKKIDEKVPENLSGGPDEVSLSC